MATTTKATAKSTTAVARSAEGPSGKELPQDEAGWSGSRYTVLGVVTLAIALSILYMISPNGNPI
jgi:hypothetical protein